MKTKNKDNRSARRTLAVVVAALVVVAVAAGATVAFNRLRALWIEQCAITDVAAQVEVTSGKRIRPDAVREIFGLRNGANLARIDFAKRRDEAMRKYPAIKSIGISRRLPDGVSITVVERDPLVRLGISGDRRATGRVCDEEGVVFSCRRGAETLPLIREPAAPGTPAGGRLEGRARAALSLLLVAREAQFLDLGILEVDTARPDYLLITLANYSAVKFRWTGMENPTPESDAALRSQLTKVAQVVASSLSGATKVWNATQPGVITADANRPN